MIGAGDLAPGLGRLAFRRAQGAKRRTGFYRQQLRQAGVDIPVGGGIPLTSPKFLELSGKAAEGVELHTLFFAGNPKTAAFTEAYKKKYNRLPDQFAALAYDATGVGVAAIRRVIQSGKPLTGQAVRDELANGPAYEGITVQVQVAEGPDGWNVDGLSYLPTQWNHYTPGNPVRIERATGDHLASVRAAVDGVGHNRGLVEE